MPPGTEESFSPMDQDLSLIQKRVGLEHWTGTVRGDPGIGEAIFRKRRGR
jgi:hypothetical protein